MTVRRHCSFNACVGKPFVVCAVLSHASFVRSTHAQQVEDPSSSEAEVVIRGGAPSRDEREPEIASAVVSGQELHQPGLELAEALRGQGSVQINQVGGAADLSTISIRGASSAQVPVYLGDLRINDDVVGVADLSAVPTFMVHRAVVYQSAPPLHLSRSGFSGALVIEPRLPDRNELLLRSEAGSFSYGAISASASARLGNSSTMISVRRSGAKNDFRYFSDQGTSFVTDDDAWVRRKNADFSQNDIWWISRYRTRRVDLRFVGQALMREQGVTGLSVLPAQSARAQLDRGLFGVSARWFCSRKPGACQVRLSSAASTTSLITRDPDAEIFLRQGTVVQRNERVAQGLRVSIIPHERWLIEGSGALELSRLSSDFRPSGGLTRRAQEVFANGEWSVGHRPVDWAYFRGAFRYQCLRVRGTDVGYIEAARPSDQTTQQCLPGGRLGMVVEPTDDLRFRASGLYGVRYPTLGERYGISSSMRGQPTLRAEHGWGADVGVEGRKNWSSLSVEAEASAYYRKTDDIIAYRRVALGYVRPFNSAHGRFAGADFRVEMDTWSFLRFSGLLSLLSARRVDQDGVEGPLPFRSKVTAQFDVSVYRDRAWPRVERASLGLSTYVRGARYADPAGLIVIPAQTSLDAVARLTLKYQIDVQLRVENLTNTARFDALGYPLPSRGVYFSVGVDL